MDTLSRRGRIAGAAAIAVFVAACSSQAGGGSTPAASAAPQASAGAGAAVTVNVHQDATLGAYVTGESGRTLYLLTKDSANTSTCSGNCAATCSGSVRLVRRWTAAVRL